MADEELFTSYESMPPRSEEAAVVVPPAPRDYVPPSEPAERRDTHLTIRTTRRFKDEAVAAAKRRGMSLTAFLETLVGLALEADRKAGLIQ